MSLLYIGLFYANDSGGIRATDNSFDNTGGDCDPCRAAGLRECDRIAEDK